ncbi:MAG: type II secretion system F family protein [Planctomycetes bacterium]|nr:type II secretion system F family protein [Planctomycetota bacterium]
MGKVKSAPAAPVGMDEEISVPFWKKLSFGGNSVSSKALSDFTGQMSTLQEAGLPIVRSLRILATQQKAGTFKAIVTEVADEVEAGTTLSEALAQHPACFDKLYVNMVRAGEAGGVLDTMFMRLAEFLEKSEKLKKKVKGAMIYPAVVMTVAVTILSVILIFVVPKFQEMFDNLNTELPAMTKFLINLSDFIASILGLIVIFLIPVVLYIGWKIFIQTEHGQLVKDQISLKLPVFGQIIKKTVVSRFTRTFGTLISSGVPILEALSITKNAVGNLVLANAIEQVHASIREGEPIAEPLKDCGLFDDVLVNMIDVGEETGELDKMLLKISNQIDYEVDVLVDSMVSLMEPILIVFLGGVVGFIVVALFMPMMSVITAIK